MNKESINDGCRQLILNGVSPTGREIGHGAYGRVFEISYEGTLCAAKEMHRHLLDSAREDLKELKESFLDECQMWSTLRHPNVVQFLGIRGIEQMICSCEKFTYSKVTYSVVT